MWPPIRQQDPHRRSAQTPTTPSHDEWNAMTATPVSQIDKIQCEMQHGTHAHCGVAHGRRVTESCAGLASAKTKRPRSVVFPTIFHVILHVMLLFARACCLQTIPHVASFEPRHAIAATGNVRASRHSPPTMINQRSTRSFSRNQRRLSALDPRPAASSLASKRGADDVGTYSVGNMQINTTAMATTTSKATPQVKVPPTPKPKPSTKSFVPRDAPASNSRSKMQRRRRHQNRKPRHYWSNLDNVEAELQHAWSHNAGIAQDLETLIRPSHHATESEHATRTGVNNGSSRNRDRNNIIVIPNERLLNYWGRHDLRAMIAKYTGRSELAMLLGNERTIIMPGRWTDAVRRMPSFMNALVQADSNLSLLKPPSSPKQQQHTGDDPCHPDTANEDVVAKSSNVTSVTNNGGDNSSSSTDDSKWTYNGIRRPKNFWDLRTILKELFDYVDGYQAEHQRPSVWMPRASELIKEGRYDLHQAIKRHGGVRAIGRLAGMVEFRDWWYFEGLYQMLVFLRSYLDEYYDGDYSRFPVMVEVRDRNPELAKLVTYYGGRKFVANKFGMSDRNADARRASTSSSSLLQDQPGASHSNYYGDDMNWGPFDLVFAIDLLGLVREDHFVHKPPLKYPYLRMPTAEKLDIWERPDLDAKIHEYGGYESVARRLGLMFFIRKIPSKDKRRPQQSQQRHQQQRRNFRYR